jgi:hypothetical protein
MAWQRLVNQGSAASLSGSAAQHVRDLLALCHIPATIPPSLAAAAADPLLASPHDGPEFMVRVRNKIAHPPHKGRKGPHNLLSSEAVEPPWVS